MDQDVRLSMEQAHAKWITKTIVSGIAAVLMMGMLSAYGCERADTARDVTKAQFDAAKAKADADKAMWDHMPPAPPKP